MLNWILGLFKKSQKVHHTHQSHKWEVLHYNEISPSFNWDSSISPFFPFKKESVQETAYFLALEDDCKEPPEHYWFLAEEIYDRNC